MPRIDLRSAWGAAVIAAMLAMIGPFSPRAEAQGDLTPINSAPNPYRTIADWAKLPDGRTWGATAGVAVDRHDNVWVAERCGANSCAGSNLPPILEFDSSGKLLKSFGAGMFLFPHGITVDKDGNIWVTDGQGKDGKGQQIFKFSQDGKVLMTLGKAGRRRRWPRHIQSTVRGRHRAERRYFRRRRTWWRYERADREVLPGRKIHQDVGKERRGAGRIRHSALRSV